MNPSQDNVAQGAAIRVLVANVPAQYGEMARRLIEEQPDMVVVAEVEGHLDTLLAATDGVDVVVVGALHADSLPPLCSHLLLEIPDLRIVVLPAGGDAGAAYWLGLRHQPLDTSTTALADGIRCAYQIDPLA